MSNKVFYVVFPNDLTYIGMDDAEVWVAERGEVISKETGNEVVNGIDDGSNEPCHDVCERYDIGAMVAELQTQGILRNFLAK